MYIFIVVLILGDIDKAIDSRLTENPPDIDGVIEETWFAADSAYDFIQCQPYENEEPSEKTVVYVLQDKENLYFAFRCSTLTHKPVVHLTKEEDWVAVGIDPFGSKTTAYYFLVNLSGIYEDGWILDDGRRKDGSWDGVWYHAIGFTDDYYVVEMKIPFKTIRYKKDLDTWGVQFQRFITVKQEDDFWTPVNQLEDDLVSKWRPMRNIRPQGTGYYFELYPEGYMRIDRHWYDDEDSLDFKPSMSLNLKWDITPQTTLNATVFPDFAQIESDPFSLNLDQYPTYLDERRPFFLEGKDIFRMSEFGEGQGFFDPLEIFYSRRVGKSMNGDAVPIVTGMKITNKTKDWDLGLLGAYTDKYEVNDSIIEPARSYGVLRSRHRVLENSSIGILMSSAYADQDDYNIALGFDGVYRKGLNQFILQSAISDNNDKLGWALSSGFFGLLGNFLTISALEVVHDSFDVSDIGFVPWAGHKELLLLSGPFKQYEKGFLSNIFMGPGLLLAKEPGSDDWSTIGLIEINPNTRNNWGCDLSLYLGPYYEADTNYLYRSINLSVWGRLFNQYINFGHNYSYCYNYRREYLAYQGSNWFTYNYAIEEHFCVGLSSNLWIEWDTLNTIIALTPRFRPNITFKFNAKTSLNIFSELVMFTPNTDLDDTELSSVRTGLLFSWNFMPKSWLYIALNDYRAQDEAGDLQASYQIGAVKAKYLFYF
jgi:hypothetical protein